MIELRHIAKQTRRMKENNTPVDKFVILKTILTIIKILLHTGQKLPRKKINFLLASKDSATFDSRKEKIGKRFQD